MHGGRGSLAAQAYRTVLQLDPDYSLSRANLALALIGLNRFDEAHQIIQEGLQRGLDSNGFHNRLYYSVIYDSGLHVCQERSCLFNPAQARQGKGTVVPQHEFVGVCQQTLFSDLRRGLEVLSKSGRKRPKCGWSS